MKNRCDIGSTTIKVCFLIAFGIAFAMDMVTEGVCMWKGFYNVGQYYEPKYDKKTITWTSDIAKDNNYSIKIKTKGEYTELRLEVNGVPEGTVVNTRYYETLLDENGNETYPYYQEVDLKNGVNIINLSGTEISSLSFLIRANKSSAFKFDIENFKLYEIPPTGNLFNAVGWFIVSCFVMILLYRASKCFLEQYVYFPGSGERLSVVYGKICEVILERDSQKDRQVSRSFLWFCILVFIHYGNLAGWFSSGKYVMNVMLVSTLFIIEAFLYYRKHDDLAIEVNDNFYKLFFWFSLTVSISNVVVYKSNLQMTGVFVFVVAGLLGYSLATFNDYRQIIVEINIAVLVHFAIMIVFCLLFRSKQAAFSYNGAFKSNDEFSYYLLFVWLILLAGGWVSFKYVSHRRLSLILLFANIVGLIFSTLFILCTHINIVICLTIVLFSVSFLCFLGELHPKRTKKELSIFYLCIFTALISGSVATYFITVRINAGVTYIPQNSFVKEYIMLFDGETMNESHTVRHIGIKSTIKYQKDIFLEQLTVWRLAFQGSSMLGHSNELKLWGSNAKILNGYLLVIYRYGLTAGFLWVFFVFFSLCKSIRDLIKHFSEAGLLRLGVVFSFFTLSFYSAIEQPFLNMLWISFIIACGTLAITKRDESN